MRTTVASPAAAPLPLGRDLAPYAVLVPLRGLPPEALRVLAARSAVDLEALRRAQARGATWNVDTTATEAEAGRIQARLTAAGVPGARIALTTVPKVIQLFLLGLFGGGLGVITGFPLVGLGVAALFFWLAAANLRAMFATVETRSAVSERERAALPADTPEARVRALRRRVADAPLPSIVLADLRADVARLEDRLDELRGLDAELAGATAADLQARRARVAAELVALDAAVTAADENVTRALTEHAEERALPTARRALAASPTGAEPTDAAPTDAEAPPAGSTDAEAPLADAPRAREPEEPEADGPRRPPPPGVTR